ncbi:MAG: nucleotidyltransferase family protein [Phycisphaerae bacterium]|nr:nucleotidyltransferase family protein [Phycisphaerae bacterium]
MVHAVEKVRQRLLRASSALAKSGVHYAVAGGNAVAAWVSTIDEAAVRNTQDVDILIRREDFDQAKAALESVGFVYRHAAALDIFLDGADASPRQGVHLVFANEKVRPHEPAPNPDVTESENVVGAGGAFRVLNLDALVRIKLTAWRDKDRTHLRDLIDVGLIDGSWTARLGGELGQRLQSLLDTPDG